MSRDIQRGPQEKLSDASHIVPPETVGFDLAKFLVDLFMILGAVNLLFSCSTLVNLQNVQFYFAGEPRTISIVLFSPVIDSFIWFASLLFLLFLPLLLKRIRGVRLGGYMFLGYLAFGMFSAFYIMDQEWQTMAALSGLILSFGGLANSKQVFNMKRLHAFSKFCLTFLSIFLVIELGSMLVFVFNFFDPHPLFDADQRWVLPLFDLNISSLLFHAVPLLLILFLFSWAIVPISLKLIAYLRGKELRSFQSHGQKPVEVRKPEVSVGFNSLTFFSIVLCSVLVAYGPYISLRSPRLIGVDTRSYLNFLYEMIEATYPIQTIATSYYIRYRPVYYLLMYGIYWITDLEAIDVIKIMPTLLTIGLAISTYFLLSLSVDDKRLAVITCFLTVFSFQTTIGLHAGIYSNWFALSIIFASIGMLMKAFSKGSIKYLLVAITGSFLVLATHIWSWGILVALMLVFVLLRLLAFLTKRSHESAKRSTFFGSTFLLANLGFALAAYFLFSFAFGFEGLRVGLEWGLIMIQEMFNRMLHLNIVEFYRDLPALLTYWERGFFYNPTLLLLAVIGTFSIEFHNSSSDFKVLIYSWILISSVGFVLIARDQFWRILYDTAFQIPAAFGLSLLVERLSLMLRNSGALASVWIPRLILADLMLLQFNYALRCASLLPFLHFR